MESAVFLTAVVNSYQITERHTAEESNLLASFHKTWLKIKVQIHKHCAIAQNVKRPVCVS